jgi:hypothetical protein
LESTASPEGAWPIEAEFDAILRTTEFVN